MLIEQSKNDQGKLFKTVKSLLHKTSSVPTPENSSEEVVCDELNWFFISKIDEIRCEFDSTDDIGCHALDETYFESAFDTYKPLSVESVSKMVNKAKPKTSMLYPIPTSLLRSCLDELAEPVTKIINLSLSSAYMPASLKHAIISPILKKQSLPSEPKSFRPVSNLSFMSKLIEQAVLDQMDTHFQSNNLVEPLQSAYKMHHSCETALLCITNDMLKALDEGKIVLLALLDLSAAFDVVDHQILLRRLNRQGIDGDVLKWIRPYLCGRTQQVRINECLFEVRELTCGMPQGSKFGPQGYKKYTEPLGTLARLLIIFSITTRTTASFGKRYVLNRRWMLHKQCTNWKLPYHT